MPGSGGPEKSGEVVPADIVPTRRRGRKRISNELRARNNALKVQSMLLAERVRDVKLDHPSWPMKRVAAEVGCSRVHAQRLWKLWVEAANAGPEAKEDKVREVRAFLDGKLHRVVERCEGLMEANASYAAAVLKSLEMLAKLHGVKLEDAGEGAEAADGSEVARIASEARARAMSVLSRAPGKVVEAEVDAKDGGA